YRWSARGTRALDLLTHDDTFAHLGETPAAGGSPHDPARMVGNGATTGANAAVHGLGRDDVIVLCSDGVHKHLERRDWCGVLAAPVSLAQRGEALVAVARKGVTVDHWATLLPLERDGATLRNVFEDCAHWWALARHSLIALDAIHELHVVHLDLKADNICIPVAPADFDPYARGQWLQPRFDD